MATADGYTFTWAAATVVKILVWPRLEAVGLVHGADQPDTIRRTWTLLTCLKDAWASS